MQLTALLCAFYGALSLAGDVAYIDATAGDGGAVCLVSGADGETRQLGPGQQDGPPHWSADGEWLAFESASPEGRQLYVVRADGSEGRLVGQGAWCTTPAWSTDGTRLIYGSATANGTPGQIRVLDLNSGEDTAWGSGSAGIVQPVWMPYSELMQALDPGKPLQVPGMDLPRFLVEARMSLGEVLSKTQPEALLAVRLIPDVVDDRPTVRTDIVLISRSEVLPLLNIADPERAARGAVLGYVTPNWRKYRLGSGAPDGKKFGAYPLESPGETTRIAFESNEGGDREIMILGRRGIANVSNHRAADWNPVWSPDGDNLAFESFRGGTRGIYNVYADTAHVTPIAAEPDANCWSPAWTPDSEHIIFVADRSGQAEIYITGQREEPWTQLTLSGGPKAAPAWRPVRR
jgi:dipeptidyl aminopeptidase/acylaminoacyl peptidase